MNAFKLLCNNYKILQWDLLFFIQTIQTLEKQIICQPSNFELEGSIKSLDAMSTFETHPVI